MTGWPGSLPGSDPRAHPPGARLLPSLPGHRAEVPRGVPGGVRVIKARNCPRLPGGPGSGKGCPEPVQGSVGRGSPVTQGVCPTGTSEGLCLQAWPGHMAAPGAPFPLGVSCPAPFVSWGPSLPAPLPLALKTLPTHLLHPPQRSPVSVVLTSLPVSGPPEAPCLLLSSALPSRPLKSDP